MTERVALWLVFISVATIMSVAILGLDAAGANDAALTLAFVIPLALGAYGVSWVVMHFSSSDHDRR